MSLELAAKYLSIDESSFRRVTSRRDVRPVELGLELERWRKTDLDALVERLPTVRASTDIEPSPRLQSVQMRAAPVPPFRVQEPAGVEALSIADATKAIGLGKSTVYKLIAEGQLRSVKMGRRTLIRREDLMTLLQRADETEKLSPK